MMHAILKLLVLMILVSAPSVGRAEYDTEITYEYEVAVDVLTVRAKPSLKAKVVDKTHYMNPLEGTGQVSTETHTVGLKIGTSTKRTQTTAPWIEVKLSGGKRGWVFGGGLSPPHILPPRRMNPVGLVGFSSTKLGYYILDVDSGACDGTGGSFFILELATNRVLEKHSASCGPLWASEFATLQRLLAKHGLKRIWKTRVSPLDQQPPVEIALVSRHRNGPDVVGATLGSVLPHQAMENTLAGVFLLGQVTLPASDKTRVLLLLKAPDLESAEEPRTVVMSAP